MWGNGAALVAQTVKWRSEVKLLSHVRFFTAPWTVPTRLLGPWEFPGKGTGVGCHIRLQCGRPIWSLGWKDLQEEGMGTRSGIYPWVGKIPGGGHSNPLQHSRLESSMDTGAWRATVHGVSQSWTPLKNKAQLSTAYDLSKSHHMLVPQLPHL